MIKFLFIFLLFSTGLFGQLKIYNLDEIQAAHADNPNFEIKAEYKYKTPEGLDGKSLQKQRKGNYYFQLQAAEVNLSLEPEDRNTHLQVWFKTDSQGRAEEVLYYNSRFERKADHSVLPINSLAFVGNREMEERFRSFLKVYCEKNRFSPNEVFSMSFSRNTRDRTEFNEMSLQEVQEMLTAMPADSVKELNLSGAGLREIPSEVYRFKNLESVYLSGNKLTSVPKALFKLKHLKRVVLHKNNIADGQIHFARNRSIELLDMGFNPIAEVPKKLRKLKKLKYLMLANTNLDDFEQTKFKKLKSLTNLNLYNCSIYGLPKGLLRCKKLDTLDLYYNELKTLPTDIYKLKRMNTLALAHNSLLRLPESLSRMENLETIFVHHNKLKTILALPQSIQQVDIGSNRFDFIPPAILDLPKLSDLDISNNPIKEVPVELLKSRRLKYLFQSDNLYTQEPETAEGYESFKAELGERGVVVK
ncbi:hypothetical protein LAG90_04235 [Marinilongibacter aquaticus]|uniref:leucine-rich repeat domain-containing protein n=1 Tax=Marinilongibacter aquaticus TaxID=2975157 RepID=UPI0021BDB24F|nr:hypothetical protein [Marinilongibacter aquaticus]UBM59856.1 hypothetical protein LAG90_04235 [Marinilongibacter aquaticus]